MQARHVNLHKLECGKHWRKIRRKKEKERKEREREFPSIQGGAVRGVGDRGGVAAQHRLLAVLAGWLHPRRLALVQLVSDSVKKWWRKKRGKNKNSNINNKSNR